jgi:hypothetical protein
LVFAVAVATMPGGRTVAVTGSYDDTVRIWDLDSGEPVGDPLTATPARCGRWTGRDLDEIEKGLRANERAARLQFEQMR